MKCSHPLDLDRFWGRSFSFERIWSGRLVVDQFVETNGMASVKFPFSYYSQTVGRKIYPQASVIRSLAAAVSDAICIALQVIKPFRSKFQGAIRLREQENIQKAIFYLQ